MEMTMRAARAGLGADSGLGAIANREGGTCPPWRSNQSWRRGGGVVVRGKHPHVRFPFHIRSLEAEQGVSLLPVPLRNFQSSEQDHLRRRGPRLRIRLDEKNKSNREHSAFPSKYEV